MHGHLKEVVLNYGPVQEFWLFSFERYNGVLGNQPTNNKNIEPQLMQRFLRDNVANSFSESFPDDFKKDFQPLFESVTSSRLAGSVLETVTPNSSQLPTKHSRSLLSCDEIDTLKQLYSILTTTHEPNLVVNSIFLKF